MDHQNHLGKNLCLLREVQHRSWSLWCQRIYMLGHIGSYRQLVQQPIEGLWAGMYLLKNKKRNSKLMITSICKCLQGFINNPIANGCSKLGLESNQTKELYQFFIDEKFKKIFHLFTCILLNYSISTNSFPPWVVSSLDFFLSSLKAFNK